MITDSSDVSNIFKNYEFAKILANFKCADVSIPAML